MKRKANYQSNTHTGSLTYTFAANPNREALFITCTVGSITVQLGDGSNGPIPIAANGYFEPLTVPTCAIIVNAVTDTSDAFIIASNDGEPTTA